MHRRGGKGFISINCSAGPACCSERNLAAVNLLQAVDGAITLLKSVPARGVGALCCESQTFGSFSAFGFRF